MIAQELDLFLSSLPVLLWNGFCELVWNGFYELAQMQGAQMSLQNNFQNISQPIFVAINT
jgi:hypothetical protein